MFLLNNKMDNRYRFGKLREAYDKGRKGYPSECVDYINSLIPKKSKVLDLGCGTGIATRQLTESSLDIIGVDSDLMMIEKAREYKFPKIKYLVAEAENLPFDNNEFDMVTAFGAFHWFRDKKSVMEIKRILKNNGVFVAINKVDNDKFRRIYRTTLKEFAKLPPSVKKGYSPTIILKRNGFYEIKKKVFPIIEIFSIDEAIVHIQSRGTWNHIPKNLYSTAVKKLKERLLKIVIRGKIQRQMELVVVHGKIIL